MPSLPELFTAHAQKLAAFAAAVQTMETARAEYAQAVADLQTGLQMIRTAMEQVQSISKS